MGNSGAKIGSSHFAGERSLDFQEEVLCTPETISHAFDNLDAVVNAFQKAGMHGISCACQDASYVAFEVSGKAL